MLNIIVGQKNHCFFLFLTIFAELHRYNPTT